MVHKLASLRRATLVLVLIGGMSCTTSLQAQDTKTWSLNSTGKSFTVVAASIPNNSDVRNVQVTVSGDGSALRHTGAGVHHPWETHWGLRRGDDGMFLVVPLPASFVDGRFMFPEPGKYRVQWLIATGDPTAPSLTIDQTVEIGAPTRADLAFLDALTKPDLVAKLLGAGAQSLRERNPTDVRARNDLAALEVIRQLLEASLVHEVDGLISEQRTPESAVVWADTLTQLAFGLPESSYSPYAAHFAACCYAGVVFGRSTEAVRAAREPEKGKDRTREAGHRALLFSTDELTPKAEAAFAFAVEHGDAYLKPITLYHRALFHGLTGEVEQSEALLNDAIQLVGEKGTVGELIRKFRPELEEMKRAVERHRKDVTGREPPTNP